MKLFLRKRRYVAHYPQARQHGVAKLPKGSFEWNGRNSKGIGGAPGEFDHFGKMHTDEQTPKGMCPCFSDMARRGMDRDSLNVDPSDKFKGHQRRRIECPHCKRRVFARIRFCDDGCCKDYQLPVHKPKHWWKKKKKQPMRENACQRV